MHKTNDLNIAYSSKSDAFTSLLKNINTQNGGKKIGNLINKQNDPNLGGKKLDIADRKYLVSYSPDTRGVYTPQTSNVGDKQNQKGDENVSYSYRNVSQNTSNESITSSDYIYESTSSVKSSPINENAYRPITAPKRLGNPNKRTNLNFTEYTLPFPINIPLNTNEEIILSGYLNLMKEYTPFCLKAIKFFFCQHLPFLMQLRPLRCCAFLTSDGRLFLINSKTNKLMETIDFGKTASIYAEWDDILIIERELHHFADQILKRAQPLVFLVENKNAEEWATVCRNIVSEAA